MALTTAAIDSDGGNKEEGSRGEKIERRKSKSQRER